MDRNGGLLTADALKRHGIKTLFTLSGGHLFPIYDGCVKNEIQIIGTRHEQTAGFAAEGMAKLTRKPAVCSFTAGPGITNGMSAVASAYFNGSPVIALGGRAPQLRWGAGSLQEMDHIPMMKPITKSAETVFKPGAIPQAMDAAFLQASTPHRGPAFLDFPLDALFSTAAVGDHAYSHPPLYEPDYHDTRAIGKLLAEAKSPVIIAGGDVYWDGAWDHLQRLAETTQTPVFMNGQGRGCLPADHELAFSRARSTAFREADLVVVAGTPLDFRLGFGDFGTAKVVHLGDAPGQIARHKELEASAAGDLGRAFDGIIAGFEMYAGGTPNRKDWLDKLNQVEEKKRAEEQEILTADSEPIHPARIYGELLKILPRDAIVICDGGDFVSYAGKFIPSYMPGRWMDPGPFGCLGTGLGYAIAARLVHPDAPIFLIAGDGAFGFSGFDFDTLVRYDLPIVTICGNNGIWGLEKHPMKAIYGYDVAADLQPSTRYHRMVESVGGHGELVRRTVDILPAIERAMESGKPSLVNIFTDADVAYPRSANLA